VVRLILPKSQPCPDETQVPARNNMSVPLHENAMHHHCHLIMLLHQGAVQAVLAA